MKVSFAFFLACIALVSGCGNRGTSASEEKLAAAKAEDKKDPGEVVLGVSDQKGIIEVETLQVNTQPGTIQASGKIALADDETWRVGVVTDGRIEKVYAKLGDYVNEGQVLARMHSRDVSDIRAEYQTAQSGLSRAQASQATAQKNYERAQRLLELKAGSLSDVERAKQELTNAEAAVREEQIAAEKERIRLKNTLGVEPDADPRDPEADLISIKAPGSGYILEKHVSPGAVIDTDHDAFVIGNLARVWMLASVEEIDVAQVSAGLPAAVIARPYPNESFTGRVTNLEARIDPATRTMQVRIELPNRENKLRPEMLATARIQTRAARSVLAVPSEAVQQINDQDVVFVRRADDRFEVRPVHIGEINNGRVTILDGVKEGETVVTRGTFLLKSQLLKASLSEG